MFEEWDLKTKEAILDLRCLGYYPQEAPVPQHGNTCYEFPSIFGADDTVTKQIIRQISGLP